MGPLLCISVLFCCCIAPAPSPLCTPEWHHTSALRCQSSADLHRSWGRVIRQGAPSAERCWPPRLWLLDLGQYVSNLRACFVWVEGEGDSCVTFHNLYPFQMLTSSHSDRSQREMLINEPDWEDGHSVTHVYYTAIKWLSKPHCVRVSAYATWWKWRSIGSYSDFSDCIWNVLFNEKEKEQRGCGRVFWW